MKNILERKGFMKVRDLDYNLPVNLLAREPREIRGENRSDSKLLVMDRESQKVEIKKFIEIIDYFNSGDILVLNDSRTINAYLVGKYNEKQKLEVQLCGKTINNQWHLYIPLDKYLSEDNIISFENILHGKLVKKCADHLWYAEFEEDNVIELANKIGKPINSHYMSKQWDLKYYQNVYANKDGSSELPAAGRHFSEDIITALEKKGVIVVYVTLHTGLSSIVVEEELFEQHKMHYEEIEISQEVADIINEAKKHGGKLFAVGTTVVRTLETVADSKGLLKGYKGFTNLYIYPGFKFKSINSFITNFHGPRSTRIAMASAFTGDKLLKDGYSLAIQNEMKFYEFGDTTLTI